ncbi:glycosyltransferase family 4 protein [Chitinophaga sp. G-6-1-13]|uniref:Glycosyltransferase family 4 protein n=1 Tax=Chitinophaga fulva TaxID=2728842 RepID=A0A848GEF5_9BACT|nr:glycosyltransferase family 4 protein [Chitinophaga fulva]NML35829.1 glycosyltransferase family 4 protein [Chitinophaga fulva]
MKVLHIAEAIYGGGAENVFFRTVKGLQESHDDRFQHFVACKSSEYVSIKPDLDFKVNGKESESLISYIYSRSNFRLLSDYLNKLCPDIIHMQLVGNLSPSVLHAVYNYKRKYPKTRIIQTAHNFEHICSHYSAYDYRKSVRCVDCINNKYKTKVFYRLCSRKGALHSWAKGVAALVADFFYNRGLVDQLIAPSDFLANLLLQRYGNAEKVKVVRNSVDKVEAEARKKKNIVTYFGRLSEEKNVELLVKSIPEVRKKVPDVKLRIIGNGPTEEKLRRLVDELAIVDIVEFLPFTSQEKLFHLVEDAKAFVLASKFSETFALVMYECVLMDIIPVVAGYGAMKEGVEWMKCGFQFDGIDEAVLAENLVMALTNYEAHRDSLVKAQQRIRQELGYVHYMKNITDLYLKELKTS